MLNKVPEVTLYFWIIKVLCTTVGETAADNLNSKLGFGLTNTTYVVGAILIAVLAVQFRLRRYVPGVYWLAVVLLSIVGTLITDNLLDNFHIALETTTIVFAVVLACVFAAWHASERTLSIHTIHTRCREAFYWLAILFTFALGTAAGDLTAEKFALGFSWSVVLFAGSIAVVAVAHYRFKLNAILSFWLAYILTRPLGASTGDLMSQPKSDGGLGLGTTGTSLIFLAAILGLVSYLSITRRDAAETAEHAPAHQRTRLHAPHLPHLPEGRSPEPEASRG
ncbi:MAG: membrane protein [Solirubrobacteraceae bacterium]